jgi:hypothetical protein
MSIRNWNAGIIRPVAVAPAGPYQDGAAPGVWTLDQQAFWQKQGLWPIAGNVNARGLFAGGTTGSDSNVIDYITIASTGNATDFGDLTVARYGLAGCSSSTRGVFGGNAAVLGRTIDYVTILTTGNATTFGNLLKYAYYVAACSNSTRGIFAENANGDDANVIQYITIATTGDSVDFGDLSQKVGGGAGCSSTTRGLFALSRVSNFPYTILNNIEYVTINTTGNATDFGDLTTARSYLAACSSNTRGVFAGGDTGATVNIIDYVTIASTGNALDFGDLTAAKYLNAGTASSIRGVIGGGLDSGSSLSNVIDYITIATTGNASDFGDLTLARYALSACSNAHGGL